MAANVKFRISEALRRAGYRLERIPRPDAIERTHPDFEQEFQILYRQCAPYTVTSPERMYALWAAVRHVHLRGIPGDIVECGVWRGGSSMLAALTLDALGHTSPRVFLFDTFAGMSDPSERDVDLHGVSAFCEWEAVRDDTTHHLVAYATLQEVKTNMATTGFDAKRTVFVQGKVEDTVPARAPHEISLLRLDTDWYESTKHELEHLWPRLSPGGVLIIDDYGHFLGARQAVDEFFAARDDAPLLNRIDYTARVAVKDLRPSDQGVPGAQGA